ncbi:cytochrome P450 4c3-like [Tenebrio molitor]|uniref:cytochrome P450 4c3-like n=1 Tax=Tenebrio molitor TaxID=7067 RepID=UPI00362484C9
MLELTLVLWALAITVFLLVAKLLLRQIVLLIKLQQLPGPPVTNLLLGNIGVLYDTPENIFKVVRRWGRDYYPIYKNWIAYTGAANVMDPRDFEIVLSNMKHIEKGMTYGMMHRWLGTGLLTSTGDKWQTRRKILTNSFHFNILQEFIKVFKEETDALVEVLTKECHEPYVSLNDRISAFTLNTIGETAMGTRIGDSVNEREYKRAIHEIGLIYLYKVVRPWLTNNLLYFFDRQNWRERKLVKTLHRFTTDVIQKHEKNFQPVRLDSDFSYSKRKRLAMLDLLLTAKKEDGSIDDEGIREEVDTFMFEGHDTTSIAICYALMLLACHRDIQDSIVAEIQQVMPDSTPIDYRTLQELKYMERCIKEVLRLYPSVPFIGRFLGEDVTMHSGHHLKAGTVVHLHIYDLHHNPAIYPDPEKFDPDRFLPENCQNRHNFAYLPFSAGPRNCIGQKFAFLELKTVLVGILSQFILEPVDTPQDIVLMTNLVLRSKDPIRVKFVPRAKPLRQQCV